MGPVQFVIHWWKEIVRVASECETGSGYLLPLSGKKMTVIYDPATSQGATALV